MKPHFRCAGVFCLFGPLIGYFAVMLVGIPLTPSGPDAEGSFLRDMAGGLFFTVVFGIIAIPFAWFIGAIPAALTGLVYSLVSTKIGTRNIFSLVLLGMLVGALVCAAFAVLKKGVGELAQIPAWGSLIIPGAIAGSLCALIWEKQFAKKPESDAAA